MTKKILVVDDDMDFVRLLTLRLKANNYEVAVAYDGLQAIERAHKEKPDLILLDLKMPAGGGLTVYENLRLSSETTGTPVIFITAYPSEDTKKKVMQKGAADFVSKPFDPEDLLLKVKKALGEV